MKYLFSEHILTCCRYNFFMLHACPF